MIDNVKENRTLQKSYLLLGLALALLILFVTAFAILGEQIKESDRRQNELDGVLFQLHEIKSDLQDAETGQRGFLLSGKESYLTPYIYASGDIDKRLIIINNAMQVDENRKIWYEAMLAAKRRKFLELARTIQLVKAGNVSDATAILRTDEGLRDMDVLRYTVGSLQRSIRGERTSMNSKTKDLVNVESWIMVGMCTMLIISIGLATTLLLRLLRRADALTARLANEAMYDSLTNLPNRRLMFQWLEKIIDQANRQGGKVGMLFIDLDGFKRVNDTLGHDAGDLLLKTVATRFGSVIRGSDLLARIGGDEFVVLISQDGLTNESLGILAQRLIDTFSEPLPSDLKDQKVGASIGIAKYPDEACTVENLMIAADEAMYRAKREGKGQFRFA